MNPEELDRSFDAALERMGKNNPLTGAYATNPLASDHYLLTKSWAYFKERIATIDKHWQEILNAKTQELQALQEKIAKQNDRLLELEQESLTYESLAERYQQATLQDLMSVKKVNDQARISWEEERQIIENRYAALEQKYQSDSAKWDFLEKRYKEREVEFVKRIELLEKGALERQQELVNDRQKALEQLAEKDDEIRRRDVKEEIFRAEVERRDQLLGQSAEETTEAKNETETRKGQIEELRKQLDRRHQEVENLQSQIAVINNEKDVLIKVWNQEKAAWRELWERSREKK